LKAVVDPGLHNVDGAIATARKAIARETVRRNAAQPNPLSCLPCVS
jgi:hypothetical protein